MDWHNAKPADRPSARFAYSLAAVRSVAGSGRAHMARVRLGRRSPMGQRTEGVCIPCNAFKRQVCSMHNMVCGICIVGKFAGCASSTNETPRRRHPRERHFAAEYDIPTYERGRVMSSAAQPEPGDQEAWAVMAERWVPIGVMRSAG